MIKRIAGGLIAGGLLVALGVPAARSAFAHPAVAPAAGGQDVTLVPVAQGPLAAQVDQDGTLTYAGRTDGSPYSVVGQAAGTYTKLPSAGQVIKCGDVLYWVGDDPVLLLCGDRPLYRTLREGLDGWDVKALNANLRRLGYDVSSTSEFGSDTAAALEKLQDARGADETGTLRPAGAVFLPIGVRVTKVTAALGAPAIPGTPVLEGTGTTREVVVQLDAALQADVRAGCRARIVLPGNRVTTGKVTRIGTVAAAGKIPVYVALGHPQDAGSLDSAPVRVQITTAGVSKALIVPVTALIGQGDGGYAVERATANGGREAVPVTLGVFDDAAGRVQVSGALAAGDLVVVPAS